MPTLKDVAETARNFERHLKGLAAALLEQKQLEMTGSLETRNRAVSYFWSGRNQKGGLGQKG